MVVLVLVFAIANVMGLVPPLRSDFFLKTFGSQVNRIATTGNKDIITIIVVLIISVAKVRPPSSTHSEAPLFPHSTKSLILSYGLPVEESVYTTIPDTPIIT